MHTGETLGEMHARAHGNLESLLEHCRRFSPEELHRELAGFGYGTIQLQLHHEIGAELYWIGVLDGRIDADDDAPDYPTVESLEAYRERVFAGTQQYLCGATVEELNTPRAMQTWGGKEQVLTPAHVFLRTLAHLYHHQGQITAMCRMLGHPVNGLDYPHG